MAHVLEDMWNYFCDNRQALKSNFHLIASNDEDGVEIYMAEEKGFPSFSVEVDGEEVYNINTFSYTDAEKTYEHLFSTYIYSDDEVERAVYCSDDEEDDIDEDEVRIEEISCAVEDLLLVLLEESPWKLNLSSDDLDEIASVIEQHLFDQYGFSVRHPTDIDGVIVQYPYGDPDAEADIGFPEETKS